MSKGFKFCGSRKNKKCIRPIWLWVRIWGY